MNETLNKAINFAVKSPKYIDFAETLLEIKRTTKAYEEATLKKDWDGAYDISITLVDLTHDLEDIARQMLEQQG